MINMAKELTKEEMIEAISDGVAGGIIKVLFNMSIAFLVIMIMLVGVTLISAYLPSDTDNIGVGYVSQSCFPLKDLECHVIFGNDTYDGYTFYFDICGVSEATAYFELKRPEFEEEVKYYNPSYELKGLYCN